MLFRVSVVTLLLGAMAAAELAAPFETPSPVFISLFELIGVTYGLTIVFALLVRRGKRQRWLPLVAALQVASDLLISTALVHLTGGTESVFSFIYLLAIVGASMVLSGPGALVATGAAVALYAGMVFLRRAGIVSSFGPTVALPLREVSRVLTVHAVAFVTTGALAARLGHDLRRASERIASQGVRLTDLANLHEDVIRCLTSGLITIDEAGEISTFNAAAAEILGIEPIRAVGRSVMQIAPALGEMHRAVGPAIAVRRAEVQYLDPTGTTRTLGVSLSPIVDAQKRPLGRIINFQDLTELRRLEEGMRRAERLAAIGRLAASIAHEIRNPLAAVSGSVELLATMTTGENQKSERAELLTIVGREVLRLNLLVTGLLEFARPAPPELQPIELGAVLTDQTRAFAQDKLLGAAQFKLHTAAEVWIEADPHQLRQILWNLFRNAAEASPPDMPIEIEVDQQGAFGRLRVRDRGAGISKENRIHLFEPFFSTKKSGTGLGLATIHRIVEEHHGRIEVESPPDGGAAFIVLLPLASEATGAA